MKEAIYLVHHEVDPPLVQEWNAFHGTQHVPKVVKAGGFLSAQRYRHVGADGVPTDPPRFSTVYRAEGLGVVRAYLEGGQVGEMREHHDAWVAGRRVLISREVLEENYSVGADGKPARLEAERTYGRAAFVARPRVDSGTVASWSAWYDRDHMPAVVSRGNFLRGGRFRVVDEAAGSLKFAVIYEAPSLEVVAAFRAGPGPALGKEHEERFAGKVAVERVLWSLAG